MKNEITKIIEEIDQTTCLLEKKAIKEKIKKTVNLINEKKHDTSNLIKAMLVSLHLGEEIKIK